MGSSDEEEQELTELSEATHIILEDSFQPALTSSLREVFDDRFKGECLYARLRV